MRILLGITVSIELGISPIAPIVNGTRILHMKSIHIEKTKFPPVGEGRSGR